MYLPYLKRKVVFYNQKVDKLANSMSFVVGSKILKNFNLFVDGRGYAGKAEEVTPPKLSLKTQEFRGGIDTISTIRNATVV